MIVEMGKREATSELVGGRLCLDFANTIHCYHAEELLDDLKSYADLVSWSRQAGVISEREARALLREAAKRPSRAEAALERARALRNAIYEIFTAVANGRGPKREDLALLNAALSEAMARTRVVATADGFSWDWAGDEAALEQMLWPIARSAADLLTSAELNRTRECGGDKCTWLFMDTSKNRSRRWCDMKGCGNRAKSRRHYERRRSAGAADAPGA
ncbi:MAG TPA: ABATE domain-containing protein [Pyrinomonadaceae bacterium]|jgi:predicted RNA-binding Zn ribbon-like protein|nr:ABATE domain-containing protein [Pyrinomonadaceae bacterium]